jgi:hypothetical protein
LRPARPTPAAEAWHQAEPCRKAPKRRVLASALGLAVSPKDSIGDPVFGGKYPNRLERNFRDGNGALDSEGNWRPLATGEILLGYPDEAQEIAGAALPQAFIRNGTFLVYRKLHENVYAFRQFINETAKNFGADFGIDNPTHAQERWRDGVPLSVAPTVEHWAESDPNARYAALKKFAIRSHGDGGHSLRDV